MSESLWQRIKTPKLRRLRHKVQSLPSQFETTPAEHANSLEAVTNLDTGERSAHTHSSDPNVSKTSQAPDNGNDSHGPQGATEKGKQADSFPKPRPSHDDSAPSSVRISPTRPESQKYQPASVVISDDVSAGSDPFTREEVMYKPWSPEAWGAQLWIAAYGQLQVKRPELVRSYTMTILEWLGPHSSYFETHGRRPSAIDFLGTDLKEPNLSSLFDLVIAEMLKKTDFASDIEPETGLEAEQASEPGPAHAREESISINDTSEEDRRIYEAPRILIRQMQEGFEALPRAPIAWAATYITLQILLRPVSRTNSMQAQILSVISKMEWLTELFWLFYWRHPADPPEISRDSSVDSLIALYESILAYHMCVAAEFDTGKSLIQQQSAESRLKMSLDQLEAAELQLVGTFNQLCPRQQPEEHSDLKAVRKSDMPADYEIWEILAKLDTNQQAVPIFDDKKSYILSHLFDWAEKTSEFQRFTCWDEQRHSSLLWITAPAGGGKSMLLRAAVQSWTNAAVCSTNVVSQVAHFFYDGTMRGQGDLLPVLKGLISTVLRNQSVLMVHLKSIIDERDDLNEEGDIYALSNILYRIIQDPRFVSTYFVLDGIEQLAPQQPLAKPDVVDTMGSNPTQKSSDLRRLIATTAKLSKKVKWLVSVEESHEGSLGIVPEDQELNLILDETKYHELSEIARDYAALKIDKIGSRQGYNDGIRKAMVDHLRRAKGNFLFFDIALEIVGASSTPWRALYTFQDLIADEPSVHGLYQWNLDSIRRPPSRESDYCRDILHAASAAYRPLLVSELIALIELPEEIEPYLMIEKLLPAFLEIVGDKVCFKHASANKYFRRKIGESALRLESAKIARRCLQLVFGRLGCNHGGSSTDEKVLEQDSGLIMVMWMNTLSEAGSADKETLSLAVHLLSVHLIEWLDILSVRRLLPTASYMITQLNTALENHTSDTFKAEAKIFVPLFREAASFMLSYRRWKALSNEGQLAGESSNAMSPEQRVLFGTDFPLIKEKLFPVMFPMLQDAPVIHGVNIRQECVYVLKHADWVRGCSFSADGQRIVSASDDGHVRIWDVQTGNILQVLKMSNYWTLGVAISPVTIPDGGGSGDVIAAFDEERIRIWDSITGNLLETLNQEIQVKIGHDLESIALSPSADMLAAAVDGNAIICHLPGATNRRVLSHGSGQWVRHVIFSPDGELVASTAGRAITIWRTRQIGGDAICTLPPVESCNKDHVSNQDTDAEPNEDKTDSESHVRTSTENEECGHTGLINGICFSPDSKFLVSGSDDCTARVWSIETCQTVTILEHEEDVNDVCFSPDGTWIAAGLDNGSIFIWRHKAPGHRGSGEKRRQPDHIMRGHRRSILSLAFSPPSSTLYLASASKDGDVRIWDMNEVSKSVSARQSVDVSNSKGHGTPVNCVAISQDGRTVASASYDGTVCCWDSKTGMRKRISEISHEAEILSMAFSPDSKLLVTTSIDRMAYVWEVAGPATSLRPTFRLEHEDWVRVAAFDGQGRLVATGGDDEKVRVYDIFSAGAAATTTPGVEFDQLQIITLEAIRTLEQHKGYVYGVAFSPDSRRLVSGGNDKHLMIWGLDLDSKEAGPLHDMKSDKVKSSILAVEFSADSSQVISASHDGTIAVWRPDATTDQQCIIVEDVELPGNDMFMSMRIDPRFPDFLLTEIGAIHVRLSEMEDASPNIWRHHGWLPLRVDKSNASILYSNGVDDDGGMTALSTNASMIYLPSIFTPTDEPYSCRIHGALVVIGCDSGHVLIFRFAARKIE